MSDHEWCRDVRRDEAIRAAEDAAAVPSIQHRDLPEVVADLRERVARLEGAAKTAAKESPAVVANTCGDGGCGPARSGQNSGQAELEAAAGTAGGEQQEPVAWAELLGRLAEWDHMTTAADGPYWIGEIKKVLSGAAAAPPRGWLTAEEREAVEMFIGMGEEHDDVDAECAAMKLRALLARSSPPRVRRPNPNVVITTVDARERIDRQWIDAIRAAGGEVE